MNITNLLRIDVELSGKIRNASYSSFTRQVMSILSHSADSWYWGIGLAVLWLIGPRGWRGDIQLLFIGIFLTALFVQGLKFIIKRPRPEGEWGQIYRSSDPHSFPSGHAARAIMLTTIMLLSGYAWIGAGMLIWAILVDLSRVGLGVHYYSDILAGTGIGVLMGVLVQLVF
ncbi:MAG: phosphatase PAP2 family protein [Anaerolineales bacterium]|nr:phosphatase PAP2 family protein [Anaerolineales bacterium]